MIRVAAIVFAMGALTASCAETGADKFKSKVGEQKSSKEKPSERIANRPAKQNDEVRPGDKRTRVGTAVKIESPAKTPNIVVVLIDALRPDYLGFQGNEYETAPFLADLAGESTVFLNALSTSSWTAPAVASLFLSQYPPQHGVVQGFRTHRAVMKELKEEGEATIPLNKIPTSAKTMPERFKTKGYTTFGVAANINIGDEIGFSRGFDRFVHIPDAHADKVFETINGWKEEISGTEPFFLYVHFQDVHWPYHKREKYFRPAADKKGDAAARYRSEIGYVDEYLKKIFGLLSGPERTLTVFVSDHGEEFWEHGGTRHNMPKLYWELNHVLFMVHGPGSGVKPARIAQNVSLVDVLPTLVDFAGGPEVEDAEGLSLKPILVNGDGANSLKGRLGERCLFGHRMYSSRRKLAVWSVTSGRWKLIDWFGDRRKLFDHKSDPGEFYDLKSERLKMTEQLTERLGVFKDRMKKAQAASEKTEVSLDQELLKRLKTLGYVE